MLNNHFSTAFTTENLNNVPDFNLSYRKKIETSMTYFRIHEQVIYKHITKLKLSQCPGPDEISPRNLKMAVDSTSKALSLIFKKGSKGDKNNCRPVSLEGR